MVTIPSGVSQGTRLKIAGEGTIGSHGASPGDLYIYLFVED